ncbi:RING finger protein 225-like [Frankliniella occidentalis]|uniref:RING finger protein 225-like n=1 Tax=Frankliniella occidentalis TaxID=133901 RepID=A0A6J1TDB2_FRAOC|nr:RING finger protein 225-like [Frankliniella occidentalis]
MSVKTDNPSSIPGQLKILAQSVRNFCSSNRPASAMECYICDICIEQFDLGERLPKVLACGHTLCLSCVRRLPDRRCPTCRREFDSPPEALPNTFALLPFLQGPRLDSVVPPSARTFQVAAE